MGFCSYIDFGANFESNVISSTLKVCMMITTKLWIISCDLIKPEYLTLGYTESI